MHHSTLFRCMTALGLSACATTDTADSFRSRGPEPSGLGMGSHESAPASESGPRFEAEEDQWCNVWIDTHGRALEPTPSLLQAWNLVAAKGHAPTRYVNASPQTEDDARVRVCGTASCKVEAPKIFQATSGGGASMQHGTARSGFGIIVPSERGPLVVPVVGSEGSCTIAPELRVAQSGSLMHVTALVHEGNYGYYHHYYEGHHGGRGYAGGCHPLSTSRTDIVIDVETAQLELVLTQSATPELPTPQVEVVLGPKGVQLSGCSGVLDLAWTG